MRDKEFSHLDSQGALRMVDVGAKKVSERVAIAEAIVVLAPETMRLLREKALPKGDALACAKVGAILAAKRTPELIPLCHSLALSSVELRFELSAEASPEAWIRIEAEAHCQGQTGVEMEAIVAAQTAAAIIYDMCKAVQRDILIRQVRLLYKSGGRSGEFRASPLS